MQGDLFSDNGDAFARRHDPDTSKDAAEEVRGEKANRMEAKVLEALQNNPNGLTTHEICEATGLMWNTASPRIRPLCRKGFVFDSGTRRIGPVGKSCIVWKAGKCAGD